MAHCRRIDQIAQGRTRAVDADLLEPSAELIAQEEESLLVARESFPQRNLYIAALHKRLSFRHEREVRAVAACDPKVFTVTKKHLSTGEAPTPVGHRIAIVPEELIVRVQVSPLSDAWVADVLHSLVRRLGLSIEVRRSGLYQRPPD